MTVSDDKVVALRPSPDLPDNPFTIEASPRDFCQHQRVVLDEHNRTVRCAQCSKVLDPFDFLKNEVRGIQSAWESHRKVTAMVRELQTRVGELQSEEKRLKARIKTARAKADPVVEFRAPRGDQPG